MASELLTPGSSVWVKNSAGSWVRAIAQQGTGEEVQVSLPDGSQLTVPHSACFLANMDVEEVEDMTTLTHLHEPGVLHNLDVRYGRDNIYTGVGSILIAVNPFKRVPHLFESGMLERYRSHGSASTSSSDSSSSGSKAKSQQRQQDSSLAPHVYGVACSAYHQMLRDSAGQAILITGESGAGKTETSKLIMRCLASLGGERKAGSSSGSQTAASSSSSTGGSGGISVEQKVLESNPLLEAFGNAKTLRNDNSSRFGKYVEIQFSTRGVLQGASLRTYLLERSRVVHVAQGERSFHVFYQMCAGSTPAEQERLHLGPASSFAYLAQSGCYALTGVDDAHEHTVTRHAMGAVGIEEPLQDRVYELLAAVLHLGNMKFVEHHGSPKDAVLEVEVVLHDGQPIPADAASWQALKWAAELLGLCPAQLLTVLTTRTRQTPEGPIVSPLTAAGADEARNALSKVLYARTFDWLVSRINASMSLSSSSSSAVTAASEPTSVGAASCGIAAADACTPPPAGRRVAGMLPDPAQSPAAAATPASSSKASQGAAAVAAAPKVAHTIGLLDIYGFESFEMNDLEQLCINLANEKLQQHFNQHVFKWEQAEYVREGIDWRYIEFVDNQEVLDLVEGKLGLLDLLDEQCRFPTSSAEDLALKYANTPAVSNSKRFERLKRPNTAFAIEHYAGSVRYSTENFLDKNKDYVVAEQAALLGGAANPLVGGLFTTGVDPGSIKGTAEPGSSTPGGHHHRSASAAASSTPSGSSHPNGLHHSASTSALKSSFKFDSVGSQFKRQLADLMAALQAMQPHYVRCIKPNPRSAAGVFDHGYVLQQLRCGGIMEAVRISCAGFAYKRPYEDFVSYFWPLKPDAHHNLRRASASSGADEAAAGAGPGSAAAQAAAEQILSAAGLQGYQLGHTKIFLKGVQAALLDRKRGAVLAAGAARIQAAWRGYNTRKEVRRLREAALVIQTRVRAWLARRLAERLRREHAATAVQKYWRAHAARKQYQAVRSAVVVLQAGWRGRAARKHAHELRRERAAVTLQSLWRMRGPRREFKLVLDRFRAARSIQRTWRSYTTRRDFLRMLPLHRAALRIQRAWRAQQHGDRIRQAWIDAARELLILNRAACMVQAAWRAKLARKQLEAMRHDAQRQRFKQQLQMFQHTPSGASQASRQARKAGDISKQDSKAEGPGSRRQSYTNTPVSQGPKGGARDGAMRASTGSTSSLNGDDVVRATDSDAALVKDPSKRLAARLQDLQSFKLRPLLDFWQEKQTERARRGTAGSQRSTASPGASSVRSAMSQDLDGLAEAGEGATPARYGQLLGAE